MPEYEKEITRAQAEQEVSGCGWQLDTFKPGTRIPIITGSNDGVEIIERGGRFYRVHYNNRREAQRACSHS